MSPATIPTTEAVIRTVSRELPGRRFIIADLGLRIASDAESYWTATGSLYEPHGTWSGRARFNNEREPDASGAIQDDILRAWPHLAPIVALHLASPNGVPMYAVENGRYHLENSKPEYAAKLWRCAVKDLPAIEDVEAYVESQRERWASEALAAWTLLMGIDA